MKRSSQYAKALMVRSYCFLIGIDWMDLNYKNYQLNFMVGHLYYLLNCHRLVLSYHYHLFNFGFDLQTLNYCFRFDHFRRFQNHFHLHFGFNSDLLNRNHLSNYRCYFGLYFDFD